MNIKDIINETDDVNKEVVVNVEGNELPLENVKIKDGKIVLIISASALEDRDFGTRESV